MMNWITYGLRPGAKKSNVAHLALLIGGVALVILLLSVLCSSSEILRGWQDRPLI
jgi:hypothetical protein